ncbi:hypothetical protein [Dickeya dadantii]|uniref:hypothetical protein n=1 Tax=Dickeya dadantii TaxID=204038 RepID=UPI0014960295|nr:hypothetical protein [Dickeya dadantii]NPE56872.1 hypothetical protein [Dickeya dadantii]
MVLKDCGTEKLDALYTQTLAEKARVEGSGGNDGLNRGGYDHLGYGTLMFTLVQEIVVSTARATGKITGRRGRFLFTSVAVNRARPIRGAYDVGQNVSQWLAAL